MTKTSKIRRLDRVHSLAFHCLARSHEPHEPASCMPERRGLRHRPAGPLCFKASRFGDTGAPTLGRGCEGHDWMVPHSRGRSFKSTNASMSFFVFRKKPYIDVYCRILHAYTIIYANIHQRVLLCAATSTPRQRGQCPQPANRITPCTPEVYI